MTTVMVSGRVLDRQVGGNTRYARSVYAGLADHGVDHVVARPPAALEARGRSAAYALFEGLRWPRTRIPGVDVLHFPADTGSVVTGPTPIVGTVHGLATLHIDSVRRPSSDKLWRTRVGRLLATSAHVLTVSQSSADDIVATFPGTAGRITPIHHGIDHDRFTTTPAATDAAALAEVDAPEQFLLYVGNLDPRKNVPALVRAASKVHADTGVPLLVCGAPAWEADAILAEVESTSGVRYLGRVSDEVMMALMRNATAFCFPSLYEGFGFPVIEAMACGAPVLCSDKGSLKELATGQALVVDVDEASVEAGIRRLLADDALRAELAASGPAYARTFTWDASVRRHAEIFTAVAEGRRP